MAETLTQECLKAIMNYDPETGVFTRLVTSSRRAKAGDVAGGFTKGYCMIRVLVKRYAAHRLAWFYMTGAWPKQEIDHINGERGDNRWRNLREATSSQNKQNLRVRRRTKSGFAGVSWHAKGKKWQAHIQADGRNQYLGLFGEATEARDAYLAAKAQLHTFNPTVRTGA